MARYCRALDPKRLKLTAEQKVKRKIQAALDEVAKGLDRSVCACPEAAEGEHECIAVIYLEELAEKKRKLEASKWGLGY